MSTRRIAQLREEREIFRRVLANIDRELAAFDAARHGSTFAEHVIDATCRHFAISRTALLSTNRRAAQSRARHVAMHVLRTRTDMTFEEIALVFGRTDHATASHACAKIARLIAADVEIAHAAQSIEREALASSCAAAAE